MLDGGLVAALLQSAKGKKLMSRSMNLLAPEHRWALLPAIAGKSMSKSKSKSKIEGSISLLLLASYVMWTDALDSSDVLLSYSITSLAHNHHTDITLF